MMRQVWFQLVNDAGDAVTPIDLMKELSNEADVIEFRDAVYTEVLRLLPKWVIVSSFIVFANRAAYDRNQALKVDSPIEPFGGSEEDAVIVVVPTQRIGKMLVGPTLKLSLIHI